MELLRVDRYSRTDAMATESLPTDAEPETVDRLQSVLAGEDRRLVLEFFETSADDTAALAGVAGRVEAGA